MMNEKMFALAKKAENAAKNLRDGKYSGGQYSNFSGDCARRAFTEIQEELEKLAKEMLRAEVLAEVKSTIPAPAEITIPEGYEEMFSVIVENLESFGRWSQCIQTDTAGQMRLTHVLKTAFIPQGYEVYTNRNCSWVYFTIEKKY